MKLDSRIFIGVAAVTGIALMAASGIDGSLDAPPAPGPAAATSGLPEGHPDVPPGASASAPTVSGVVEEAIPAAGYTYVRLTTADGEIWVAGPEAELAPGEEIGLVGVMDVGTFESASLGRTFDPLYFTDRFVRGGTEAAPTAAYRGTVLEAVPVSRYVYVRVEADDGAAAWLAAPGMELSPGDEVAWSGGTTMRNFFSESLDRTFDEILFVTDLDLLTAS